jgi:hypothetical protein
MVSAICPAHYDTSSMQPQCVADSLGAGSVQQHHEAKRLWLSPGTRCPMAAVWLPVVCAVRTGFELWSAAASAGVCCRCAPSGCAGLPGPLLIAQGAGRAGRLTPQPLAQLLVLPTAVNLLTCGPVDVLKLGQAVLLAVMERSVNNTGHHRWC